jgi:hypothetical protein
VSDYENVPLPSVDSMLREMRALGVSVAEIARMLGGERLSGTAHAQALLQGAAAPSPGAGAADAAGTGTPTRAPKRRSRT